MRAQFKSALGKYPEEAFRSFVDEPFAAASLGQVHSALTKAGDDLIPMMTELCHWGRATWESRRTFR